MAQLKCDVNANSKNRQFESKSKSVDRKRPSDLLFTDSEDLVKSAPSCANL